MTNVIGILQLIDSVRWNRIEAVACPRERSHNGTKCINIPTQLNGRGHGINPGVRFNQYAQWVAELDELGWSEIDGAYGPATDVVDQIIAIASDDETAAASALRVCHNS